MPQYCINFDMCPYNNCQLRHCPLALVPVEILKDFIRNREIFFSQIKNIIFTDNDLVLLILSTWPEYSTRNDDQMQKFWNSLIKKNPDLFDTVPTSYQSEEMCIDVANHNPYLLKYMNQSHISPIIIGIKKCPEIIFDEEEEWWIVYNFQQAFLSGLDYNSLPEFIREITREIWDQFNDKEYDYDDIYNLYSVLKSVLIII